MLLRHAVAGRQDRASSPGSVYPRWVVAGRSALSPHHRGLLEPSSRSFPRGRTVVRRHGKLRRTVPSPGAQPASRQRRASAAGITPGSPGVLHRRGLGATGRPVWNSGSTAASWISLGDSARRGVAGDIPERFLGGPRTSSGLAGMCLAQEGEMVTPGRTGTLPQRDGNGVRCQRLNGPGIVRTDGLTG